MKAEAKHLESLGIDNPFSLLTVHPQCPVTTPYHRAVNRIIEEFRDNYKHGSCGVGIGETRRMIRLGLPTIRAVDLTSKTAILNKLWDIRDCLIDRLKIQASYLRMSDIHNSEYWPENIHTVAEETQITLDLDHSDFLSKKETLVFEGAQGFWLDEYETSSPNRTWSTVTTKHAVELLEYFGREFKVIGCTRIYATRHGAGDLAGERVGKMSIEDPNNPMNKWQGCLRCAPLDWIELRQATERSNVDVLAISHIDQWKEARYASREDAAQLTKDNASFNGVCILGEGPTYKDRVYR
jgi:adenylosuccinate synthase